MDEKKLAKLIKDKKYTEVVSFLESISTECEAICTIQILKTYNAFIDVRGNETYNNFLTTVNVTSPLILNHIEEVRIFNSLFTQEKVLQNKITAIPEKDRFAYLFFALNRNYLGLIKLLHKGGLNSTDDTDKYIDIVRFETAYSSILKSLFYDKSICKENVFIHQPFLSDLDFAYFRVANQYMRDATKISRLHDLYDLWKGGIVCVKKVDQKIVFDYIHNEKYHWLMKSYGKLSVYDSIAENEHALISKNFPRTFTDDTALQFPEVFSLSLLKRSLHQQNEDLQIKEIPIKYWIKAYECLINYSKRFWKVFNESFICWIAQKIKTILMVKSHKSWVKQLTRSGIPVDYADKILGYMIHTNKSDDLFDFPFISIRGKYLLCYSLLSNANGGLVLESRFNQPDISYSERGHAFEEYVMHFFAERNIPATRLHRKENKIEYECDLAFVLDNVLFLCELKDYGDKQIRKGMCDFYVDDVNQLLRIGNYFEDNKDYVIEQFLKKGHKVNYNKTIKILVYNTYLQSINDVNGVRVIDFNTFIAPIRRGNLDLRVCDIYAGPIDCLVGNFTAKKFLKYIKTPFYVCDYDKIWEMKETELSLGDLNIETHELTAKPINREEMLAILSPLFEWGYSVDFQKIKSKHSKRF